MYNYRKEVLPNGIRIVSEEIPYVRSVAIGIWVGIGSRDENDKVHGASHFIEHLLFKGTKNRSAKEIAESLESVGGQLNAFTTKEYTCYYAKVLDEHLDLAIDVLTDMFFNSLFEPKEVEKEKNVVLEEIKMYEDSPDELVHDLFSSTIWEGHPLGRSILGTCDSITQMDRQDIINYYESKYTPHNIVVAVAGKIKHEQVVARLTPIFTKMSKEPHQRPYQEPEPHRAIKNQAKETEQVQICVGTPGLPQEHELIYPLHVLNNVLGGGLSSRLFQEIREERGLAYSIYSYHSAYRDAGLFTIYAGTRPDNYEKVLEQVLLEIKKILQEGISAEELNRTKEQIKGNMYLGLESVSSRMSRLGKSELSYGRLITPDEVIEKITAATREEVLELARFLFQKEKFSLTTIGPEKANLNFATVLDRTLG